MPQKIGLISDTHDLLRPQALAALAGCDAIIHAGDICGAAVLASLAELAPVTSVRGNNDRGAWAETLPETASLHLAGCAILVIHDLAQLRLDPAAQGYGVVVAGHSHRPAVRKEGGVLFVNPGSAGPRRFKLPISLALLTLDGGRASAELRILD
ncbi:MAG: metallophosphoesterase family protein [Rhodocyclaceae bacterium]|nr:metallophosphoesterase family protein [Rhodocyclaceae bacterium]MBX3668755.1 metallophosphoesterase family protein [Rhodocyclaceae bacterium]